MIGIMFALKVAMFAFCIGAILSFIILVPLFIYTIPYSWWAGGKEFLYPETKEKNFFHVVRNATRLYKAWITHTEPKF